MFPTLLSLGPIQIHSYGVLIALGLFGGTALTGSLAKQSGLNAEVFQGLMFKFLALGMLGARMLFVVTMYHYFLANPAKVFAVWEGGFVFLGGLFTCIPYGIYFMRKNRINAWRAIDVIMPGIAVGQAFGRVGCFLAGCCYGKPTDSFIGVRFPAGLIEKDYIGIPVHPTQLYESFSMALLALGLVYLSRRKLFDGQIGLTYFMAYPIIRSIIEVFRGDTVRGFVIGDWLSTSQFLSIFIFAGALAVLMRRAKQVQAMAAPIASYSGSGSGSRSGKKSRAQQKKAA